MYFRTALEEDWNNPKDITAKDIAECLYEAPTEFTVMIGSKLEAVSEGRRTSIAKALNTLVNKASKVALHQQLLVQVHSALGKYFELLGGSLYDVNDTAIIDGGSLPYHIRTVEDAVAVKQAIEVSIQLFNHINTNSMVREHNHKQNHNPTTLAELDDAVTFDDTVTNMSKLDLLPNPKDYIVTITELVTEHLLSNGFTNINKTSRLASKIIKLTNS